MLDSLFAAVDAGIGGGGEIALLVSLLALLVALRALRTAVTRGAVAGESEELLRSGVQGKMARLERSLNELRTETRREIELLKGGQGVVAIEEAAEEAPAESSVPAEESSGTLEVRLEKTRAGFFDKLKGLFSLKPKLDAESLDELEALLISADLGVSTSQKLLDDLKTAGIERDQEGLRAFLKEGILQILAQGGAEIPSAKVEGRPRVVLVVGINGVGKTTSVAKLAHNLSLKGAKVLMVAADTFRAAAVAQLEEWGRRIAVPVVAGLPEARPQTVVFDAMQKAVDEQFDVVLIDTAGRLHTKSNLMQELEGISNIVKRFSNAGPDETVLVLDGATGQNALQQAKEFNDAVPLSGLIITKLDGTPKGGIVVAIKRELGVPIRYIGVGEAPGDLRPFDSHAFADAILSEASPEAVVTSQHAETRREKRAANQ